MEPPAPLSSDPGPTRPERLAALLEVLICSGFPTQLAIGATLAAFGYQAFGPDGGLRVDYVAALSLVDACLLLGLVALFVRARGERLRDLFLGWRPVSGEALLGLKLLAVVFVGGVAVLLAIRAIAPSLQTVRQNPIEGLLTSPGSILLFAFVVLVAGGVREEVQRAFLLHRFEGFLGGGALGVAVTSVAFGAGHLLQGVDAAVVTGLLGAFWGILYLRRRSIVAAMVSHAGFDLLQILQFVLVRGAVA